jgi:hypothetical protein
MQILRTLFVSTMLFTSAIPALAQNRSVDVRFPAGATGTTISDSVTGRDTVLYKLGAEAGQTMNVVLSSNNTATYFNVYAPGSGLGDAALVIGEFTDPINTWSGTLDMSGEYTVAVFLYRAAARRGETAAFTLDLSVLGETGARVEGDFADGLAGGPDFFEVSVSGGGTLNMRAGPSAGASVVTRLANGQNLRNLGCRMAEGGRWCRVATMADPGYEGWAAGDFLIEGSGVVADPAGSGADVSVGDGDERVQFAAGASGAELRGLLAPGESRRYTINAQNGQFLTVRVATQAAPISYQIFNPDRTFLLDMISTEQDYRGQLWQSGDHVVEVINRTNGDATYSVVIGIE